jgi:hypothetical protein
VEKLAETFQDYVDGKNVTGDLSPIEAADFLQKNGKTRTAMERQAELKDVVGFYLCECISSAHVM